MAVLALSVVLSLCWFRSCLAKQIVLTDLSHVEIPAFNSVLWNY